MRIVAIECRRPASKPGRFRAFTSSARDWESRRRYSPRQLQCALFCWRTLPRASRSSPTGSLPITLPISSTSARRRPRLSGVGQLRPRADLDVGAFGKRRRGGRSPLPGWRDGTGHCQFRSAAMSPTADGKENEPFPRGEGLVLGRCSRVRRRPYAAHLLFKVLFRFAI
jgi:hypothetical protein